MFSKGYLNNPTATADTVTSDGWLRTGDVVVRDKEGYYWIVDRRKELIKYKVGPVVFSLGRASDCFFVYRDSKVIT